MVGGLNYAQNLADVRRLPLVLEEPNKVVYVAHDYSWFHANNNNNYNLYKEKVTAAWGYIALETGQPFTAPVFVSEFGTCHTNQSCYTDSWFQHFLRFMEDDASVISWGYWPIDGTSCYGEEAGRVWGSEETFGMLNMCWNRVYEPLLQEVKRIF